MVLTHGFVQSEYGSGHIVRLSNLELDSYTYLSGVYKSSDIKDKLMDLLDTPADAIVFEGFPFDRYDWKDAEVEAILNELKQQDRIIISSVRDIVPPWEPEKEIRAQKTVEWANDYFDYILVHSDPKFCKLEDSFPYVALIDVPIIYTGYVCGEPYRPGIQPIPRRGWLVSVGNGEKSEECFSWAIEKWGCFGKTTFCAGALTSDHIKRKVSTHNHKIVNVNRDTFLSLLKASQMHLGHCGYNTFTDVVQTKTPSVWFAKPESGDQPIRIGLWNKRSIRNLKMDGVSETKKFLSAL
tara:strand:+ start:8118 stop:9005 length:888 start_codon:yes stop_codon:yes gene_type:complete